MTSARTRSRDVIVVLAVFEPDPEFLRAQLASIANQTLVPVKILAVIADRRSDEIVADACLGLELAFECITPPERTTSCRSFEVGLVRAVEISGDDALIALADQDDIWNPKKLEESVARIGSAGAGLVHCDARVVDAKGRVIHPSLHRMEGRSRGTSPRALLVRNSVTGMCSVMTRQIAEAALPFPAQSGVFFHHDTWLALIASCLGGIEYLDSRLVDYRQHGRNVVGAVSPDGSDIRFASRLWIEQKAGDYAVAAYLATSLSIRMDEVVATGKGDPDRDALSTLAPFLRPSALGGRFLADAVRFALTGKVGLAARALDFAMVRVGRMVWASRYALVAGRLGALAEFDRKLFHRAPGAVPAATMARSEPEPASARAETFSDPRLRPRFSPRTDRGLTGRFVVLVPTLNPSEIFAGVATALDLGLGLASRGYDVVFLATDLPVASAGRTREFLAARVDQSGKAILERVEIVCGVRSKSVGFSTADTFLATAWWSAHVIGAIQSELEFDETRFLYLIQDFEPAFYPWGADYAGAVSSYGMDFLPLFNTGILRDYFIENRVFDVPEDALSFRPAIDVERYAHLKRRSRKPRRLALYGRPEVPRNLFPLAIDALADFLKARRLGPEEIDLVSVGLSHDTVGFPGGHQLRSLGKIPWEAYPQFLSEVDVGLSLMLSPHPSHPPIEWAAAGARVVTNTFATKDIGVLTPAILSVPAEVGALSDALGRAWDMGPASPVERSFDLGRLGLSFDELTDQLATILDSRGPKRAAQVAAE